MGLRNLLATGASPHGRRRLFRIAVGALSAFVVVAVLGYFVGPPLLRSQLESRLSTLLGRTVTVVSASFNPFTLEARIGGFAIGDPGSDKPLLSFDELYVDASIASLKELAPVIAAVRLTRPAIQLIRLDGTRYNFTDIVERFATGQPSSGPGPRFAVGNIEVLDGRIEFDDRPMNARHEVSGLQLGVPFVSNFPAHIETKVLPSFAATINGDPFVLTGESTPFKDSHETSLKLALKDVDLPRYLDYVPLKLQFKVPKAKLETDLRLHFSQRHDGALDLRVDGAASLAELEVVDNADALLLGLDKVDVVLQQFDLLANKLAIERIDIRAPKVHLQRHADGQINLAKLAPRTATGSTSASHPAPTTSGARPLQVQVAAIKLIDGRVDFVDEANAHPFRTRLSEIEAELTDLTIDGADPARYSLSFKSDTGLVASSSGALSLASPAATGTVKLANAALTPFAPYFEPVLAAAIVEGSVELEAEYRVKVAGEKFELGISKGGLNLNALRLTQSGTEIARVGKLSVEGIDFDLGKQTLEIASLSAADARAGIKLDADGKLNFATLLRERPADSATSKPAPASQPWTYAIKRVALDRANVQFEDASVKPAVSATLSALQLTLGNLSSAKNTKSTLAMRTAVNKGGKLALAGTVALDPIALDLSIDASALDVVPFEPYFTPYMNVSIASGAVTTKGKVSVTAPAGGAPRVRYDGDVSITNLDATDKNIAEELLKWRALDVTRLSFASEPMNVDIGEVAFNDFYARVVITQQGKLNLQSLLAAGGDAGSPPPTTPATVPAQSDGQSPSAASPPSAGAGSSQPVAGAKPNVRIGKISLQGGNVNFSDFFIKPNYTANLTNLAGGVSEITPDSAGDVDVRGRVNNTGALEITGKLNPLAAMLYLDLKAAARDIDLPALTPYSAKYVGYGIQKGKLSVKIAYKIEDDKLTGENSIYLDQLTFGEKVESPDALQVPVLLAVALLKDRHGVIDINLPISGTLSDPEFSIGGIIVRVIVNLIVKAVTSPFTLLASAFGGGGEELSYAEFAAGRAELDEPGESRLKTLAKALEDRPGLTLEVAGRVAPDEDRDGLRRVKLEQQLKAQKFKELARSGTPVASIDKASYQSSEYERLLREAYRAASFAKPRTAAGLVRDDLSVAEMEKLILANAAVTDEDLRTLASQRAQNAKDHLVERGGIAAERIFIVAPKLEANELKDQGKPTRVEFSLR